MWTFCMTAIEHMRSCIIVGQFHHRDLVVCGTAASYLQTEQCRDPTLKEEYLARWRPLVVKIKLCSSTYWIWCSEEYLIIVQSYENQTPIASSHSYLERFLVHQKSKMAATPGEWPASHLLKTAISKSRVRLQFPFSQDWTIISHTSELYFVEKRL